MSHEHEHATSVEEHRAAAPATVNVAVLTMSDTRGEENDTSGRFIKDALTGAGISVVDYRILPDETDEIRAQILEWIARDDVDAILTNGGTGITSRDATYDAVSSLLEKKLDGFGELFRMLSWDEIGAASMLSRAVAGAVGGKLVVAMPGSTAAVRLAMEKLILPELRHLVYELRK